MTERSVRLAVSVGCPCGVGPEIAVAAARLILREDPSVRIALHGDVGALEDQPDARALPERLEVVATSALSRDERRPGSPGPAAGAAQLAAIDRATDAVLAGDAHALVTGPVSKSVINRAGVNFHGHTEHLAARAGVPRVVMSFLGPRLRVALVTTHVSIAALPAKISADLVRFTAVTAARALQRDLGIARPRIVVAGLNPHAGEGGCSATTRRSASTPASPWRGVRCPRRRSTGRCPRSRRFDTRATGATTSWWRCSMTRRPSRRSSSISARR